MATYGDKTDRRMLSVCRHVRLQTDGFPGGGQAVVFVNLLATAIIQYRVGAGKDQAEPFKNMAFVLNSLEKLA